MGGVIFVSVGFIFIVAHEIFPLEIIGAGDSPICGFCHCPCHILGQVAVVWGRMRGWGVALMIGWEYIVVV